MLRLRNHLFSGVRAAFPPHHHHPFSTTTPAPSPARFAAEEYLVATCGLTPAQAAKASKGLAHLKSPANPDAVLSFLAGAGLAKEDIAAGIARHPQLLCCKVDKTLTPRFAQILSIGLSPAQISRIISIVPNIFVAPSMISRLQFYLSLLGTFDLLHFALKRTPYLLGQKLEVVKPNMALLLQCGLTASDLALFSKVLTSKPERVKEMLACAEKLGVPRNTGTFKAALWSVHCVGHDSIGAKMDLLKATLGCSEAELALAVRRAPQILRMSEGKLSRALKFLKVDVGLNLQYILLRPPVLGYSMERRLIPRHYFINILKAKGLAKENVDFYNAVCISEKKFFQKFIDPHRETIPGLADFYATTCAGKISDDIEM
ncbi:transcription termination factor MTERF8, chloroplastic-like [Panicum virgatum]|uniref:Uncharacterized protein n=1 Tax=Panicum virgatum TaxID=38727 RepID=A0A8T0XRR8_PANVG|nr:transcription termination factor MTERF8, chloroplastic-like [Panicum virgatum]KAG2661698.1 hypothetical protein PVAP13_1KG264968 [Panicum virgatum]